MAKKKVPVDLVVTTVTKVLSDKNIQKAIFGSYSDDTPRSLKDALDGEILSPKQKQKHLYKKKKKKNKKIKL